MGCCRAVFSRSIVDKTCYALGVSGSHPQSKQETRFQGVPVASGIAHGRVIVHWLDDEEIPFRTISGEELPEEIARFESALIATRAELLEIQQRLPDAIGTKDAGIFDAHLLVVEDRTLIDEVLRNLEKERHNVEYTFHQAGPRSIAAHSAPSTIRIFVSASLISRTSPAG